MGALVASRMPSQDSGGRGCLNASSPTGGNANGIPRYSSHPSLTMPLTSPYSVVTVLEYSIKKFYTAEERGATYSKAISLLSYVNYDQLRKVIDPDRCNAVAEAAAYDERQGVIRMHALIKLREESKVR